MNRLGFLKMLAGLSVVPLVARWPDVPLDKTEDFNGRIESVRFWDRELSDREIAAEFDGQWHYTTKFIESDSTSTTWVYQPDGSYYTLASSYPYTISAWVKREPDDGTGRMITSA